MSETLLYVTLKHEECCDCGIVFGMTTAKRDRLLTEGGSFYCPNGHRQHYTKTKNQELKDEITLLKRDQEWLQKDLKRTADQRDRARNQKRAEKAAKTRLKNRVSKGVCPCCNRTFSNLARHMKSKHPEEAKA